MPSRRMFGDVELYLDATETSIPLGDLSADQSPVTVRIASNAPITAEVLLSYRVEPFAEGRGIDARTQTLGMRREARTGAAIFSTTFGMLPRGRRVSYDFIVRRAGRELPETGRSLPSGTFSYSFVVQEQAVSTSDNPAVPSTVEEQAAGAAKPESVRTVPPGTAVKPETRERPTGTSASLDGNRALVGASRVVSGTVLLPPSTPRANIEVELHAAADLNRAIATVRTDERGRFEVTCDVPATGLWFRFGPDPLHRSARLLPWTGGHVRLARCESTKPEGSSSQALTGVVRTQASARPLGGIALALVEQTLSHCRLLARGTTEPSGAFTLAFARSALLDARAPDLRILAMAGTGELLWEGSATTIELPESLFPVESAHSRAINAYLASQSDVPIGDLTDADAAYLVNRKGVGAEEMSSLRAGYHLAARHGIRSDAAFALASRGVKLGETLEDAVRGAVNERIVSESALQDVDALRAKTNEVLGQQLLDTGLAKVLARRLKDSDQRGEFLRILSAQPNDKAGWAEVEKHPSFGHLAQSLQFTVDAARVVHENASLVHALERRQEAGAVQAARGLGAWSENQWGALLSQEDVAIPSIFTRDSPGETRVTYARHLTRRFEREFPSEALRAHAERSESERPWGQPLRAFLKRHPALDLSAPVHELERAQPGLFDDEEGRKARLGLRALERVRPLTPQLSAASALLEANLTSANAIAASRTATAFVEEFHVAFGGKQDALEAYDRAAERASMAKWVYALYGNGFDRTRPRVTRPVEPVVPPTTAPDLGIWRRIFETDDLGLCECSACKSVFGPAAYLFDMLVFLRRYQDKTFNLLSLLRDQRPDILGLPLTCANTNIEVPYIDLVNELLEQLVSGSAPPVSANRCGTRITSGTSVERKAEPEFSPDEIVVQRLAKAGKPWTLPFDRNRVLAAGAVAELHIDARPILRERVRWDWDNEPELEAVMQSAAMQALSLSGTWVDTAGELGMLCQPAATSLELVPYWTDDVVNAVGTATGPSLGALQRASALSYAEIFTVIGQRYVRRAVRPDASPPRIELAPKDSCNVEEIYLDLPSANMLAPVLDRIHRFTRLMRKLDWAPDVLDDFLDAVDPDGNLDETSLLNIGLAKHMQTAWKLSADETLLLFTPGLRASIDRLEPDGHEPKAARERVLGQLPAVQPAAADPAEQRVQLVEWLCQAAGLASADVEGLVEDGLVAAPFLAVSTTPQTPGLNELATTAVVLSRFKHLSEATRRPITEILAAAEVTGRFPFPRESNDVIRDAFLFDQATADASWWPVPADTAANLFDGSAEKLEALMPSPTEYGALFRSIASATRVAEVQADELTSPVEVRLREALKSLLGPDAESVVGHLGESPIDRIIRQVSHSAMHPDGAELDSAVPAPNPQPVLGHMLPADAIRPGDVLVPAEEQHVADKAVIDLPVELTRTLNRALTAALGSAFAPSIHDVSACVDTAILQHHDPLGPGADLSAAIESFLGTLTLPGGTETARLKLTLCQLMASAAARLTAEARELACARWLPLLSGAASRLASEERVIALVASSIGVGEPIVGVLARHVLRNPADPTEPFIRAFVPRKPKPQHLEVRATYQSIRWETPTAGAAAVAREVGPERERTEDSFFLDWATLAVPEGIDAARFRVRLVAKVSSRALLDENNKLFDFMAESAAHLRITITDSKGTSAELLSEFAGAFSRTVAPPTLTFPSPLDDELTLEVELTTPAPPPTPAAMSTGRQAPLSVALYIVYSSSLRRPIRHGALESPFLLLAKASRLVASMPFEPSAWTALATRGFDLNTLPIEAPVPPPSPAPRPEWFDRFIPLAALASLAKHSTAAASARFLACVLDASAMPTEVVRGALGLASSDIAQLVDIGVLVLGPDHVTVRGGPRKLAAARSLTDTARATGLSVKRLLDWHAAPATALFAEAIGALKSRLPKDRWSEALQRIHDPVREAWRDALVAYALTHGAPALTPSDPPMRFARVEDLKHHLLVETLMSCCLSSSRIEFAYSAVQRFIRGVREGQYGFFTDPKLHNDFEGEWSWRQLYRLWEANRRVFVHPENWIEPDLRPDKTHLFRAFEEELLSDEITHDLAQRAFGNYVAGLAHIARPEIIGVVEVPAPENSPTPYGFRTEDQTGVHVFARSRTQPHELYYRRRHPDPDKRWMPWERIDVNLTGTHFVPVFAFGKVMLYCFDLALQRMGAAQEQEQCVAEASSATPAEIWTLRTTYSWIERVNTRWEGPRRGNPATADIAPWVVAQKTSMEAEQGWSETDTSDFPESKYEEVTPQTDHLDFDIEVGNRPNFVGDLNDEADDALEVQDSRLFAKLRRTDGSEATFELKSQGTAWRGKVKTVKINFPRVAANNLVSVALWHTQGWPGDSFTLKAIGVTHARSNGMQAVRHASNPGKFFKADVITEHSPYLLPLDQLAPVALQWARDNGHFKSDGAGATLAVDLCVGECVISATQRDHGTLQFGIDLAACLRLTRARRYRYIAPATDPNYVPEWDTGWQDGDAALGSAPPARITGQPVASLWVHGDGANELRPVPAGEPAHTLTSPLRLQRFESENSLPLDGVTALARTPHRYAVASKPASYEYDSRSAPKLYDEIRRKVQAGESDVLRTFFLEKREAAAAQGAPTCDVTGLQVTEVLDHIGQIIRHIDRQQMFTDPLPILGRLDDIGRGAPSAPLNYSLAPAGLRAPRPGRSDLGLSATTARGATLGSRGSVSTLTVKPSKNANGGTIVDAERAQAQLERLLVQLGTLNLSGCGSLYFQAFRDRFRRALNYASFSAAWDGANNATLISTNAPNAGSQVWLWWFEGFYHPQARGFLRLMHAFGIPSVLSTEAQRLDPTSFYGSLAPEARQVAFFQQEYQPSSIIHPDVPRDDVDFSIDGTYSDYNWELFFHGPLLIAERLSRANKFEDAEKWFRLLFDPARGRLATDATDSFRTLPLNEHPQQRLEDMLRLASDAQVGLQLKAQIDRLNKYPYQPHLIARARLGAYQKTLVMKYIDHLFAWGDELFRRAYALDQRTFLYAAGEKYDEISRLLGPRPQLLPSRAGDEPQCFDSLVGDQSDTELWDPVVEIEHLLPQPPPGHIPRCPPTGDPGVPQLFFCLPHNDTLFGYWDRLADRQFKLGQCLNLEGNRAELSLYGRTIDPGLLVRATAMGLDIDSILAGLAVPLSRFRFQALWQRAREVCAEAKGLGQSLLGAVEKKEGEELTRMRAEHEILLLKAGKSVKEKQLDEAKSSLAGLEKSREAAEQRKEYYATQERQNANERSEGQRLVKGASWENQATADSRAAAGWALVPDVTISGGWQFPAVPVLSVIASYSIGGTLASKILGMTSTGAQRQATLERTDAARAGREAGFARRWEDWRHQERLAAKDIEQIDEQMRAATSRQEIAATEIENHEQQIVQAEVAHAYMRDKFSSAELYRWMEKRLYRIYRQQYRLAVDLAQRAERALAYELGLDLPLGLDDPFDPAHLGQTAADDLMARLDALQARYLKETTREDEKTKDFSLTEHDPFAFLELVQTGSCVFDIREDQLDADEPAGGYFRRLKAISITIPCVKRPYASVNARLTLLRSSVRLKAHLGGSETYPRDPENADPRFRDDYGSAEHIVTSSGVRDAGVFELNLNSEKRLPFEGAGAISTWRLDLSEDTNDFDRRTLTDAVLHVMYTARDGGQAARAAAIASRNERRAAEGTWVLIHSSALGKAWDDFVAGQEKRERTLKLEITKDHLPYGSRAVPELKEVRVLIEPNRADAMTLLIDPVLGLHEIRSDALGLGLHLPIEAAVKPTVECFAPIAGWLLLRG